MRTPPRIVRRLAAFLISPRDREFILGDLEELYLQRVREKGRAAAWRWYVRDAFVSVLVRALSVLDRRDATHYAENAWRGRAHRSLPSLRTALRTLWRQPGFTLLVVFTLSLGVGASAAVFGMADQLLLQPMPGVHDSGRAADLELNVRGKGREGLGLSTTTFDLLRHDATLLTGLGSFMTVDANVSVGDASSTHAFGMVIDGDFFRVLGVVPKAGRLLGASEVGLKADPLRAVISERLSDRLFGSAGEAVGKTIRMNGHSVTVVGVASDGFVGPMKGFTADFWLPWGSLTPLLGFPIQSVQDQPNHVRLILRPRAGVSLAAADVQITSILNHLSSAESGDQGVPRLAELQPEIFSGTGTSPHERRFIEASLRLFAGVALLVLLIACANVANLLLFQNAAKQGSVAVRRTLGASRGQVIREHFTQSLVLGALGAGGGVFVGWLVSLMFRGRRVVEMLRVHELALDHRLVVFAAIAAAATTLLFGTVPATLVGRFDLTSSLQRSDTRHSMRLARFRSVLSAGQLALTLTLVVGALLLVRSMYKLLTTDTGFDIHGVSEVLLNRPPGLKPNEVGGFYHRVLSAVEAVPGVEGAALGPPGLDFPIMGQVSRGGSTAERVQAAWLPVSPSWLSLLRIRVIAGRRFEDGDWGPGAPSNVILTQSLARRLFGRTDVVGRTILAGLGRRAPMKVIGIAGDLSSEQDPGRPIDAFLISHPAAEPNLTFTLVLRTHRLSAQLVNRIRRALEPVMPGQSVAVPSPMSGLMEQFHAKQLTLSRLLTLLAVLAITLGAIGLYALTAFVVAGRQQEFGIRLAVGATGWDIGRLVLRYTGLVVGAGGLIGLGGAYVFSHALASQLFEVGTLDAASYVGGIALIGMVALLASWVPTLRATHTDPAAIMREE